MENRNNISQHFRSEEQLRILSDSIVEGILITDFSGKALYYNEALLNMIGLTQEEIQDKINVIDYLLPEFRAKALGDFIKVFTRDGRFLGEYKILTKNGREIWIETLGRRIRYQGKAACFNVVRDVTERMVVEEELSHEFRKLEEKVRERTEELEKTNQALNESICKIARVLKETINALAFAVEKRDPYTAGHQINVSQLACEIARAMGLPKEKVDGIYMAAIIHDIGKIYLPAEILGKPRELTSLEFSMIKTHCDVGYEILRSIEFPWAIANIILQHHERINGTGYPHGLKDEQILIEAKIIAVADVVEAMASHRPYRPAVGIERALEEIQQNSGILYDQEVVQKCQELFRNRHFRFGVESLSSRPSLS